MPSGIDLLGGKKQAGVTGKDLLQGQVQEQEVQPEEKTFTSGINLLSPPEPEPTIPVTKVPVEPKPEVIKEGPVLGEVPSIFAPTGIKPFTPPETKSIDDTEVIDEDAIKQLPTEESKFRTDFINTMKGYGNVALNPDEAFRGAADFFLSIPGFISGLAVAGQRGAKNILDQVLINQSLDLEQLHGVLAKSIEDTSEFFQPAKEAIIGKSTPESELVVNTIMSPALVISHLGHDLANDPIFSDSPNIRGAAKLAGDTTALLTIGKVYKGSGKALSNSLRSIVERANKIKESVNTIGQIPKDTVKSAQLEALKAEKVQLEIEAGKISEELSKDSIIAEEVGRKVEQVAREKVYPIEETGVRSKIEQIKPEAKVNFEANEYIDPGGKAAKVTELDPIVEINKTKTEVQPEFENNKPLAITDQDMQLGADIPKGLSTEKSPFRETPEHTKRMSEIYENRKTSVNSDVELFTGKLINDTNRWLDGDNSVNISEVRKTLSEFASRGDELRGEFLTGADHFAWKTLASDAASWSRNARRPGIEAEQTRLYSGLPVEPIISKVKKDVNAAYDYFKKVEEAEKIKVPEVFKKAKGSVIRNILDKQGNIKSWFFKYYGEKGYETIKKSILSKGAPKIASDKMDQMFKEVYSGLHGKNRKLFEQLSFASRMKEIGKYKTEKEFKFPDGFKPDQIDNFFNTFAERNKISSEVMNNLMHRVDQYYQWMKDPLEHMLETGLISEKEFDNLSKHNYRKLKLADIFDVERTGVKKGKRSVYESGVEKLARGFETDLFSTDSQLMAIETFSRAYGRGLNNQANITLAEMAKAHPENPFARLKEKGVSKPRGWEEVSYFEQGEKKSMYLSPEMSKEWVTNNPEISYKMAQMVRFLSGSSVLRTFATGINWSFALAQLPLDIMHTWFTARSFEFGPEGMKRKPSYSSYAPVFAGQMAKDLSTVFNDALLRKGKYKDYIDTGGGMETLTSQGRFFQRRPGEAGPIGKILDFMAYFGETSEIAVRLANRERALKNIAKREGLSVEQVKKNKKFAEDATLIARDYIDFAQGGNVTKAMDHGIAYLNAGVQATKGIASAFKTNPVASTFKLAQFAGMTTGLYIAMQKMSPKTFEDLKGSDAMKNNIVIPLGDKFAFKDSQGQTRYPFFKIPIGSFQKFFKKFFEASIDKSMGNEVDPLEISKTLTELSPVGISSIPPLITGPLGYASNKDFWTGDNIQKESELFDYPRSAEEYRPGKTPQALIDFGRATGISPERGKYFLEEFTTSGTIWSYLLGQGYDAMFSELPKSNHEEHLAETLSKVPISKRFFGITHPYAKHAKDIDEARDMEELKIFKENRGLDTKINGFLIDKNVTKKEIFKYIDSFKDIDTVDRLERRLDFTLDTKDLPNRSFWLSLRGLPPAARAKVYLNTINKSTPAQKKQLLKEEIIVEDIGGVFTDKFWDEVDKIELGIE